jgi:hypothetical protein
MSRLLPEPWTAVPEPGHRIAERCVGQRDEGLTTVQLVRR